MRGNSSYDILPEAVQFFLNSNPPRCTNNEISEVPGLKPPSLFYERHLDTRLMLKKVQVVPLEHLLSRVVDLTLESAAIQHTVFPKVQKDDVFHELDSRETITLSNDAARVATAYRDTTSLLSRVLTSTLLFHPRAPRWYGSTLEWGDMNLGTHHSTASLNCYGLDIRSFCLLSKNVQDVIDNETRELIGDLNKYYRPLAWWEIFSFSEEAKALLADFDRIASAGTFDGSCQTFGYRSPPLGNSTTPLDAASTPWRTPVSSFGMRTAPGHRGMFDERGGRGATPRITRSNAAQLARRRSIAKGKRDSLKASTPTQSLANNTASWPEVRVSEQTATTTEHFLLRAWAQSVEYDTTFIIFHCGNFERIGFRHRESQTLFISSLVDIHNCSNPSYGRLQAGLYLAIVEDAINRVKQQQTLEAQPKARKRRRNLSEERPTRQYKTRSAVVKDRNDAKDYEALKLHVPTRSLALVELRSERYNSSAPAAFIRSGTDKKSKYGPDDYLSLVLTSEIGKGAIGVVYDARLEIVIDGCICNARAVVKLAFEEKEVESMRHEYSVYQHLYERGVVDGIPHVFGFFVDIETGVGALVMSCVGKCLWDLRPDETKDYVRVSSTVEEAYVRILKKIHRADICHGDIGEQNLMLMDDERATLIDFDRAKLFPSEDAKRQELEELFALLHQEPSQSEPQPITVSRSNILAELDAISDSSSEEDKTTPE
ncbi:hypothetical protein C0992_011762 [Termitomyces sp. T32_za158]|nr:hypothetical protein C0992_011762 [Termitomyces sp. T32_za158]